MATVVFDCARVPEEKTCSVKIVGERDDVFQAAHDHLVATHGLEANSELQQKIKRVVDDHQGEPYGMWGH